MEELHQNFMCPVCLQLARNAVQSSCCVKIYCEECSSQILAKFGECPCCRSKDFTCKSSKISRKIISEIKVPCDQCQKMIESGAMKQHLELCPMKPTQCSICHQKMKQQKISNHTATAHEQQAKEYLLKCFLGQNQEIKSEKMISQSKKQIEEPPFGDILNEKLNRGGRVAHLGTVPKFYCQGKLMGKCDCCDGNCGPDNGQNCDDCMLLDVKRLNLEKGYLVNPFGYVCLVENGAYPAQKSVHCLRLIEAGSKSLFSKTQPKYCNGKIICQSCNQVAYSIFIGRYKGLYNQ